MTLEEILGLAPVVPVLIIEDAADATVAATANAEPQLYEDISLGLTAQRRRQKIVFGRLVVYPNPLRPTA